MPLSPLARRIWPSLRDADFQEKSPDDRRYNCIAFAVDVTNRRWDPLSGYWPDGVSRDLTLDAFEAAFATEGYERCNDPRVEPAFDKIAIYADAADEPLHAAKQLPSGEWMSKLGDLIDIEHVNQECLEGRGYGQAKLFMRRPRATQEAD
jgi:hypothetical protein